MGNALIFVGAILGIVAFVGFIVLSVVYGLHRNSLSNQGLPYTVTTLAHGTTGVAPDGQELYILPSGFRGPLTINKPNVGVQGYAFIVNNIAGSSGVNIIPGTGVRISSSNGSHITLPAGRSAYFVWLDDNGHLQQQTFQ